MNGKGTNGLILVTGATGIVGIPLVVSLLKEGFDVRAIRRPSSQVERVEDAVRRVDASMLERLSWVAGDMTDGASLEQALEGVSCVYHCAALVSFHPADHAAMTKVNVDGTANLVNAMLHCGTPRLVHVSSVAALGRKAGVPTDETTLFEEHPGTTAYARSKHRAEMEAWRGAAEGLPGGVVVVNPVVVLGEGDFSRSSGALFEQVHRGLKWHPTGSNGFVHSHDVARACVRLGMSDIRDERFVLCAGTKPYKDLMQAIAKHLGVPGPSRAVQPWMAGLAWRLSALVERLFGIRALATRESLANTGAHHAYDGTKISRHLPGWSYTPIDKAIAVTAEAFLRERDASC